MDRIRKISKVFHKDPSTKSTDPGRVKPTYRGTKPLIPSDIHGHSPLVGKTALQEWCDELGSSRPRTPPPRPSPEGYEYADIIEQFPKPPALNDGSRTPVRFPTSPELFYPKEDLLPPLPDKVLRRFEEIERARSGTYQSRTPPSQPPLYSSSRFNMSTHSLGAHARSKTPRAEAPRTPIHSSELQRAAPAPAPPPRPTRKLPPTPTPEGERKRLRSVPTPVSRAQRDEELRKAYLSLTRRGPTS